MRIGDSVLGTYRYFTGSGNVLNATDIRRQGKIDSLRMPLGYYWVRFKTEDGEIRQMNHEAELNGDPRSICGAVVVRAEVIMEAVRHFRAGYTVTYSNGQNPKPTPKAALDELAAIGQEEVIL